LHLKVNKIVPSFGLNKFKLWRQCASEMRISDGSGFQGTLIFHGLEQFAPVIGLKVQESARGG
jgi:hypothetical protein